MSVQAAIKDTIRISNVHHWEIKILPTAEHTNSHQCSTCNRANENENKVPIFTVNDIEVHIYSSDEHMAVNSDFIDRRGRQGMSHNHETHDLAGDGPPMGQRHSEAEPSCDVNHLEENIKYTTLVKSQMQQYYLLRNAKLLLGQLI